MRRMNNANGSGIRPGTFKRLMAYLFSHYRVHLITVIICIIVTAVVSVGQTVYIQILIDQCILPGVESGMDSVWPQMRSIFTSMAVIYAVGVLGIPDLHPHHGNGNPGNFKKFPCGYVYQDADPSGQVF